MTDYLLQISFPPDLEDVVHGQLFLTRSTGNAVVKAGIIEAYFNSAADRDAARSLLRDFDVIAEDRAKSNAFEALLAEEQHSELALLRDLSLRIPPNARIYLGNSLPIREWDLAATRQPRGFTYEANRGANGIDGQLSTFFGWCAAGAENWCVVGDLTAIYDFNAPWVVPQLDAKRHLVFVEAA